MGSTKRISIAVLVIVGLVYAISQISIMNLQDDADDQFSPIETELQEQAE